MRVNDFAVRGSEKVIIRPWKDRGISRSELTPSKVIGKSYRVCEDKAKGVACGEVNGDVPYKDLAPRKGLLLSKLSSK